MTNTFNNEPYMMLRITGAYLKPNRDNAMWRNFSGRPTTLNPKGGNRYFTIDLNQCQLLEVGNNQMGWKPVTVQDLINMGWKIKIYDARERYPDSTPNANLNVVVSYEHKAPIAFQYTSSNKIELDENIIGCLDDAWIDRAQILLGHSKTMTAYLNTIHAYIKENPFSYDDWTQH